MSPFDFVLKIKIDRDFILESDAKKKVSISGEFVKFIKKKFVPKSSVSSLKFIGAGQWLFVNFS